MNKPPPQVELGRRSGDRDDIPAGSPVRGRPPAPIDWRHTATTVVAGVGILALLAAVATTAFDQHLVFSDFRTFWMAFSHAAAGRSIYPHHEGRVFIAPTYIYPPVLASLGAPLSQLACTGPSPALASQPCPAAAVWSVSESVMLFAAVLLSALAIDARFTRRALLALALTGLYLPVYHELALGQ